MSPVEPQNSHPPHKLRTRAVSQGFRPVENKSYLPPYLVSIADGSLRFNKKNICDINSPAASRTPGGSINQGSSIANAANPTPSMNVQHEDADVGHMGPAILKACTPRDAPMTPGTPQANTKLRPRFFSQSMQPSTPSTSNLPPVATRARGYSVSSTRSSSTPRIRPSTQQGSLPDIAQNQNSLLTVRFITTAQSQGQIPKLSPYSSMPNTPTATDFHPLRRSSTIGHPNFNANESSSLPKSQLGSKLSVESSGTQTRPRSPPSVISLASSEYSDQESSNSLHKSLSTPDLMSFSKEKATLSKNSSLLGPNLNKDGKRSKPGFAPRKPKKLLRPEVAAQLREEYDRLANISKHEFGTVRMEILEREWLADWSLVTFPQTCASPQLVIKFLRGSNISKRNGISFKALLAAQYPEASTEEIDYWVKETAPKTESFYEPPDEQMLRDMTAMWDRWDLDGSGELNQAEFKMAMKDCGVDNDDDFDELYTKIDTSQNGTISREEFMSWWVYGDSTRTEMFRPVNDNVD